MNNSDLDGLPEEVRQAIGMAGDYRSDVDPERLATLSNHIAKLRDEAIAARKESGIEKTWMECEEAYLGIDDENRAEFHGARWAKPMTGDGPLVMERRNSSDEVRATAFYKLTSRYVDAGRSKVCETTLPVDGKPFSLKATPVADWSDSLEDDTPAEQITGQPMPGPDGQPVQVKDLAKAQQEKAELAAEKCGTRIYDWMVEYKHNAEMRKVIDDAARIGVGVLKGPIPETVRATKVTRTDQGLKMTMVQQVKPVARWVDPWRFYPAPGCREDVSKGGHAFEVEPMLPSELRALGETEKSYFDAKAIAVVLNQGPGKCYTDGGLPRDKPQDTKQFEVWHFHGQIPRLAFEAANPEQAANEVDEAQEHVFAIVTLVNDTVIRAVLQALDTGRLPYHVFCWSRRAGCWAGVGVAEQVRTPQRVANAGWRRMLSNGGMSSGSQVVIDADAIEPANKSWAITPDKLWWLRKGAGIDDVRKAFAAFQWPNTTQQIMIIIEAAYKAAEEHSSIPLISQGQSGDTTPDTFGGQQLQDNNANQLLRDVGFRLNDSITTPLVDQMYEWLLLDEEVPEDEKGDFKVDTSGAMALIEKALQDQFLPMLVQLSADPSSGLSRERTIEQWIRSKRMSPELFALTDAEKEKIAQQPPPVAPQIEVAKIRAQSAEAIAQSRDELAGQRNQNDLDRDTAYNNSLAERARSDRELGIKELELKVRLIEAQERMSVEAAKVKVFETTAKLQVQKELSGADGKGPQVATPPVEPAGRAPDGRAYQQ